MNTFPSPVMLQRLAHRRVLARIEAEAAVSEAELRREQDRLNAAEAVVRAVFAGDEQDEEGSR